MCRKQKNDKGFTLIEIAIVTLISSLVLFSVFKALSLYAEEVAAADTVDHVDISQSAISRFFEDNGRYPCPARINAVPGDADYGLEQCTPANLNTGNGLNNPIDADEDTVATPDDFILVGTVPILTLEPCLRNNLVQCGFRDFYITEEAMYDGWGKRITYAVTQDLTDAGTFSNNGGVIDIQDENKESILEQEFSAHFVLISHGSNGRGSFNRNGDRVQDNCVASIDEVTLVETPFPSSSTQYSERENCDHINGIFVSALVNEGDPDRTYFDDDVYFRLVELASLWERTGLSEMINKNEGFVGVGDFSDVDPPTAELHVRGDLQAIDLYANRLCDDAGTNCFVPEFLGGPAKDTPKADADDFQNTCANASEAIVKISGNAVSCAPVFTGGVIAGECPKDDPGTVGVNEYEVMVGYSNQTGIICERLYP